LAASVNDLANKLVAGGRGITRANRVGVEKACLAGKTVMLANLVAALGPDRRMSGVGRSGGARVGVGYDVMGYMNPVGIISYRGPAHLANNPTKDHLILPRQRQTTAKGNKRRGAKALSPTGRPWAAASAQHPGTKGLKFHEKSEPVVLAQSKRIIDAEVRGHLARTYTGR
jgi:hypothetical protein